MKKIINIFANINIAAGVLLLIIPVGFLLFSGVFNNETLKQVSADEDRETEILSEEIIDPNYTPEISTAEEETEIVIPKDNAVTYGNKVIVPSVGIDALIFECASPECGLDKGIWRIPDFGTPKTKDTPMVLAGHRWGPDNLPTKDRVKNLFYNGDKIFEGDIIEIHWNNEVYKYVVTFKEENTYITRNQDDLILFTCKYYNSPVRIIIYAARM